MSDIKTLKDFGDEPYLKNELREEAKTWRSVLSDKIEDSIKYVGKRKMNLIPVTDILYYSAQIRWITHFFNLEEEDE